MTKVKRLGTVAGSKSSMCHVRTRIQTLALQRSGKAPMAKLHFKEQQSERCVVDYCSQEQRNRNLENNNLSISICSKNQINEANSSACYSNFNQITASGMNVCEENASHSDDKPTNVSSETVRSLVLFGTAMSTSDSFSSLSTFKKKCDAVDEAYKDVQEMTMESPRKNLYVDLEGRQSHGTAKDQADRNSTICRKLFDSPCPEEIESFLAASEQQHHKQLSARYNFDFVNGVPLEGRYKWVSLQRT